MADIIVYNQNELNAALKAGIPDIVLCAGIYKIPLAANTAFSRLGPVKADVLCSRRAAETEGMKFIGFDPAFHDRYAVDTQSPLSPTAVTGSGGTTGSGSWLGSGSFPYGSGSFGSGSGGSGAYGYYYEYEFEYRFAGSGGSFSGSYSLYGSFGESYNTGSAGGASALYPFDDTAEARAIRVFGYGINLI